MKYKGVESDLFLPYVGLVQRMVQTIAGPRAYELVYARLGEIAVVTEPEVVYAVAVVGMLAVGFWRKRRVEAAS